MTHDHRNDPDHPDHPADPAQDDTRVVERERYVERPVETGPPPGQPASQVNVSSGRGGYTATSPSPLYYARRVLSLLFTILAVLLGLRILLLLFVANQTNAIVDFVYGVTEPFVAPFRGIFQMDAVSPGGGSVFDIAALVALVGWLLIYLLLVAILSLGDRTRAA